MNSIVLNTKQLLELIEKELANTNFIKEPNNLYEPVAYTMSMGGKRIRPVLCLLANQLFEGDINAAIKPALALEIFHNFTLLHDDIMDNADVRRSMPTVHKKWNSNVGILSGDAMLITAYQYLEGCDANLLKDALTLFNDVAIGVCEGQQYDMDFENRMDVSVDEYLRMIRLKTAILLAGSLKLGALLAGANAEQSKLIYEFGINIGIAFQLQDDYLDSFGDQDTFGKRIGGDIVCNKKTFLLLSALHCAEEKNKQELERWIQTKEFNEEQKISAIKKIYTQTEVDKKSQVLMEDYYKKAMNNLDEIDGNSDIKKELIKLASKLMKRNN